MDLYSDSAVILKALLHYAFYDDAFYLSRVLDEYVPSADAEKAMMALDVWWTIHLSRMEDVFISVRDYLPLKVSDVKIKKRSALLEFTYEEFIDAS